MDSNDLIKSLVFASIGLLSAFVDVTHASPERRYAVAVDRAADGTFSGIPGFLAEVRGLRSATVNLVLDVDWTPEGYLTTEEVDAQRANVTAAQDAVLSLIPAQTAETIERSPYTPTLDIPVEFIPMVITRSEIRRMEAVGPARPMLSTTISQARSQAALIHDRGNTGAGKVVALLDTGVTPTHSSLFGKVVSEACYSTNNAQLDSLCFGSPTTVTSSVATGSGSHRGAL